jgi:hypothetical protein
MRAGMGEELLSITQTSGGTIVNNEIQNWPENNNNSGSSAELLGIDCEDLLS